MVFVNEVADFVHGICHRYLGCPNKNIGDAFLTVWKFFEEDVERVNGEVRLKDNPCVHTCADMAAISHILIIAAINKSKKLARFRSYEALNERMPNYRVRMGFSIHAGWAIEGAIGSEYKIDATYLSPHVTLTMALEEATKTYGVPYIISHHYHNLLSDEVRNAMRPLDRITLHGFEEVTEIYTFDMDINSLEVDSKEEKEMDKDAQINSRIHARKQRDATQAGAKVGKNFAKSRFLKDPDIKKMHKPFTPVI
jgi:class 3 adenylate cyclase